MYRRSIKKILETEEQARQNAARCFCISKNIPIQEPGPDYVQFASSEPSDVPCPQPGWMRTLTQQLGDSIDRGPPAKQQPNTITTSSPSSSQTVVDPGWPSHLSSPEDPLIVKKIENIYKMLKPAGMFVKSLPDVYLKTYGESLDLDALPYLRARENCFTFEETIPGRIIVCPVPGADVRSQHKYSNNNNHSSSSLEPPPSSTSPSNSPASSSTERQQLQDLGDTRLQLLEKGSELEVIFCYAYSASEIYFQLTLSEDVFYEIQEVLNQSCNNPAPADWSLPASGLVAATYQDGWYRAQIQQIHPPKVQVYFIDYGNTESVDVSELRPLPQNEVTQLTPPLALKCALAPSQAKHLRQEIHTRLEELSLTHPVLKAVVLDNSDVCIVELQLKDGTPLIPNAIPFSEEIEQEEKTQQSSSTSEPDKLVLPDTEAFAAYICQIMSECTVLLRVVDTNYSDALDQLEQEIAENLYRWPVPQQVKERQVYAAMVLATADEAEDEGSLDQNKYNRVRVQRENKDGSFTCYLPDHSGEEILQRNQLREIDPQLNRSLPYQAVLATLHGLNEVEEALKPTAMEILMKQVNQTMPIYAVRHGNSQALEVDIVDTDTDVEVNINESVLAALDEVREGLGQGRSLSDVMHAMFGSSSGSHADSGSVTSPSAATEEDAEDMQAALERLSVTGERDETQDKLSRVQDYVDDLPVTSASPGGKLYTWNTTSPAHQEPAPADPRRLPALPRYWSYSFLKSVSLYITWVGSPSHFVAIPLEQQGALDKVEAAMAQYFSSSPTAAGTLSEQGLYAVRSEGKYRRALYMGLVGNMVKIFFPDHFCYDTVEMEQVLSLPEQFYTLPFLAYKMRLRAMRQPNMGLDWPEETTKWFRETYLHKALYAFIFSQDGGPDGSKHTGGGSGGTVVPGILAVRLIDTSGEDDVIVDEHMEQLGMAVNDQSLEQV